MSIVSGAAIIFFTRACDLCLLRQKVLRRLIHRVVLHGDIAFEVHRLVHVLWGWASARHKLTRVD